MQSRKKSEEPDYYAALGIDKTADAAAIKKAYRGLVLTAHPDKVQDEAEKEIRTAKFMVIQEAYKILSDPDTRKKYDADKMEVPKYLQKIISAMMSDPKKLPALLDNAKAADPKFDINKIIDDRGALMHIAAAQGKPDALQILIDKGADVNVQDEHGNTPLHLASGRPGKDWLNASIVLLDSENVNVNIQNKEGNTPLHICTDRGFINNINEILANKPDLALVNHDGKTVMDLAASGTAPAHKSIASLFQEELNPKNAVAAAIDSALDSLKGFFSSPKEPVKPQAAPPPVEKTTAPNSSTSDMKKKMDANTDNTSKLHDAIKLGDLKQVTELLKQGADINKKIGGDAAIHVAAKNVAHYNPEIVTLLMAKGANVNQADRNGDTLLHLAVNFNDINLVQTLLNNPKTDVNAQNNSGETALHVAAYNDHEDVTIALLSHATVKTDIKDKEGNTAAEILEVKMEDQAAGVSQHTVPTPHNIDAQKNRSQQNPASRREDAPSVGEESGARHRK